MIPAVGYSWRDILDGLCALAEESAEVAVDHVVRTVREAQPDLDRCKRRLYRRLTRAHLWDIEPFRTLTLVGEFVLSDWSDDPPTIEEVRWHADRSGYWAGWSNWIIVLPSDQTVMIEHVELNADDPAQIARTLEYAAKQGACSWRAVDIVGNPCWWKRATKKAAT